jgi:hypothetical protein
MGYREDRRWSDKYIPRIKQLVGPYLLEPAPFLHDAKEATDLIILTAKDMRVACRVRRESYFNQYGGQFTIRHSRTNGTQTEFDKILMGLGDWMFYGFASERQLDFLEWYLIDLAVFRYHLTHDGWRKPAERSIKCDIVGNKDNATSFTWFDVQSFPPDPALLVASGTSPHPHQRVLDFESGNSASNFTADELGPVPSNDHA